MAPPWGPGARALRICAALGLLPRIGGRAERDYWARRRLHDLSEQEKVKDPRAVKRSKGLPVIASTTRLLSFERRRGVGGWGSRSYRPLAEALQEYLKHDGCLLISDDPNLVEIADQFELMGKPVWRYLAEVPRAAG
jgi:hypothetical protein